MSMGTLTLNVAYVALISASLMRTMLWLRLLLIFAAVCFVTFGLVAGLTSMVIWNVIIGGMHMFQLIRTLFRRRRARLSEVEESVRHRLFDELDPNEFYELWVRGEEGYHVDGLLIEHGASVSGPQLILAGQVEVRRGGKPLTVLGPGSMIGEMSRAADQPASADCYAVGPVKLRRWRREQLDELLTACPAALLALERHIQRDLLAKGFPQP